MGGSMNKSYLFFIFLLSLKLSSLPSLTNRCGEKRLKLNYPENVSVVVFDKECETAYVGPPANGIMKVDSVLESTSLWLCTSVRNITDTLENAFEARKIWGKIVLDLSKLQEELFKSMSSFSGELGKQKAKQDSLNHEISLFETSISQKELELEEASDNFKKCQKIIPNNCNNEIEIYNNIDDQISKLKKEILAKKYKLIEINSKIKEMEYTKEETQKSLDKIALNISNFKIMIRDIEVEAFENYQKYGQIYGINAGVTFETNWSQIMHETVEKNKDKPISIEPLPLLKSSLLVEIEENNKEKANLMHTVIEASFPGLKKAGDLSDLNLDQPISLDVSSNKSSPLSSAISGIISLNLFGSCNLVDRNNKITKQKLEEKIGSLVKMNINHEYPLMQIRKYEIRFNPKRILDELESVTENNGFLYREKIHEVIENNITDDLFNIRFYHDSTDNGFTKEEQAQIKLDAKREIVDKILNQIGAIAQIDSNRPPIPRFEDVNGPRISTMCFGHTICYVTGFFIETFHNIFGSSNVSSRFKQSNNINIFHQYESESPVNLFLGTTFMPRIN